MHEEKKHNEKSCGSGRGLMPQQQHTRASSPCTCRPSPGSLWIAHTRARSLTRTHTLALFSQRQTSWQMADSVTCSTWVRKNVYESISLTPNLLPPLPHKPHSKVIQRATEVRFCICFIFYFGKEKRHSVVFWHVLQTSSVSAEVTLPPTSSLGPGYSTSRAKFMEKGDGYKFEVSISYL